MKALAVLIILLLALPLGRGEDLAEDGPRLEISSLSGHLQLERPSVLTVQLINNASALAGAEDAGFDARRGDAIRVMALLQSSDDRIKVLSGPQVAGAIAPGESRSLEFTLLAEGDEVGIYPLQLRLNYSWLTGIAVLGDKSLPDILFEYQDVAKEVPLQAKVVQGPRIRLEELKGEAFPGEESELQLLLVNRGDEPAQNFRVKAGPQTPFSGVEIEEEPNRIDPNALAAVKLKILTEADATSGIFALPCLMVYGQGHQQHEDLALLVSVKKAGLLGWLLPGAVLLLLLAGGFLAARRYLRCRTRSRRRL